MLYLQEKDSRMEFERNMNLKLENQELAQSNLKAWDENSKKKFCPAPAPPGTVFNREKMAN